MRTPIRRLAATLTVLSLAACQNQGTTYTQADLDAAEAEVSARLDAFWEAWSSASMDEGMTFYSDSPDGSFINDGVIWESKSAAEATYRPFFEELARQEFDVTHTRLLALTPNAVYATLGLSFTQYFRNGDVSGPSQMGFSMLWVKEAGEWKALGYHFSTQRPPPATLKSVHLVNLPSTTTEEALVNALTRLNAGVREAGYENAGYDLFKLAEPGAENPNATGFQYFWEGTWPDQAAYEEIHSADAYLRAQESAGDLFGGITPDQLYSRYVRMNVGGPGER